jgi:hypothetical protein
MLKKISKKLTPVLHAFDKFGEPVAPLNIKGQSTYKTHFGGLVGLLIYTLMIWYMISRLTKLDNREDPIIY